MSNSGVRQIYAVTYAVTYAVVAAAMSDKR
jgi:hypothetical protein